jgi:hypothetical protein
MSIVLLVAAWLYKVYAKENNGLIGTHRNMFAGPSYAEQSLASVGAGPQLAPATRIVTPILQAVVV